MTSATTRLSPLPSTKGNQYGLLMGSSSSMQQLFRRIRRVSGSGVNTLLTGEPGSGKKRTALTLHQYSPLARHPFMAIDCAMLSDDPEEAAGSLPSASSSLACQTLPCFGQFTLGTLYLDEITAMPMKLQDKLATMLAHNSQPASAAHPASQSPLRIIAATQHDPIRAVTQGRLQEQLYFQLAQFPVQIPPLRERDDDAVELAQHFLQHFNRQTTSSKSFSRDVIRQIRNHDWPGNVSELRKRVEQAHGRAGEIITATEFCDQRFEDSLISGHEISPLDHQKTTSDGPGSWLSVSEAERQLVINTLNSCQQNRQQAAALLGITVEVLDQKLAQ
ncbi:sigma-54-dependent transcriptional regulator [Oceanobacter mangrovi]|uniref:sigma-54-dependent transcriptional regulator n=1 Tax=Oceanobacter mangrovi TaxID=2862510 RepID=UPI001C8E699A|nr:sigma 54-interacting transcriptional regulator [Oceanobacter mangrovi]